MNKIKDIGVIQTGVYLKSSPIADTFYYQVNDFDNEQNTITASRPTVHIPDSNSHHLLKNGDILFASKGTNNFSVELSGSLKKCVASSSFLVIKLSRMDIVLPKYLVWYLNLPSTIAKVASEAVGTSIPSIPMRVLEELEVPTPSIEKQRLIIKIDELKRRERTIFNELSYKKKQLLDYKLKNIIR